MSIRRLARLLAVILCAVCLGAAPTVDDFATAESISAASTAVVMHSGNAPYTTCSSAGCEFVVFYFNRLGTAPSLSGTWTTICTNTAAGYGGVYRRAVTSSDNSSSVTILSSGGATALSLDLVANYYQVDASSCAGSTSGTPSLSATATASLDLGLELGGFSASGTSLGTPAYTQCSGYTLDANTTGGTSSNRASADADHKTGLASGTNSCSPSWTVSGSPTATDAEAALVLLNSPPAGNYQPLSIWHLR